jgi:hypothetical protein
MEKSKKGKPEGSLSVHMEREGMVLVVTVQGALTDQDMKRLLVDINEGARHWSASACLLDLRDCEVAFHVSMLNFGILKASEDAWVARFVGACPGVLVVAEHQAASLYPIAAAAALHGRVMPVFRGREQALKFVQRQAEVWGDELTFQAKRFHAALVRARRDPSFQALMERMAGGVGLGG